MRLEAVCSLLFNFMGSRPTLILNRRPRRARPDGRGHFMSATRIALAGAMVVTGVTTCAAFNLVIPHNIVVPHVSIPAVRPPVSTFRHSVPAIHSTPVIRTPKIPSTPVIRTPSPSVSRSPSAAPSTSNLAGALHASPTAPSATTHAVPTVPNLLASAHAPPTVPNLTATIHPPPTVPSLTQTSHATPSAPSVASTQSSHTATATNPTSQQPAAVPQENALPQGYGHTANYGTCSTITGPGMGGPSAPCITNNGNFNMTGASSPTNFQQSPPPAQVIQPPRVVTSPPPCVGCYALDGVAEILPTFGQLLADMDQEINSPNIPPPSQWVTEPPPPVRQAQAPPGADDADLADADSSDVADTVPEVPDNSFEMPELADRDYAELCQEANLEYLTGQDSPEAQAREQYDKYKQQYDSGMSAANAAKEFINHPIDFTSFKTTQFKAYMRSYWDTHFTMNNTMKFLQNQIVQAAGEDRQEDLKRFKEKWADKCVQDTYKKQVDQPLQNVQTDPDQSDISRSE